MKDAQSITIQPVLGATLFVTGSCIGAGMMGLPLLSAAAGFLPSTVIIALCYLFTTCTGLLLLEATLWFKHKVNLPSIVEFAWGKPGKYVTYFLFLFLFYCLFVAYFDAGGQLFSALLGYLVHQPISPHLSILVFALLIIGITYAGTHVATTLNKYFMLGLIVAYGTLVTLGLTHIDKTNLQTSDWAASIRIVPILLVCFGYQNLVPSLTSYLKHNVNAIRFAIMIGNFIPVLIYVVWNAVILGLLPASQQHQVFSGDKVIQLLENTSSIATLNFSIKAFSLFAILTSFIPSAISFIDFLHDGFTQKQPARSLKLHSLIYLPPLIATLLYPHLFLQALNFAGGFIDVLLFGLLPASTVLIGRYYKKQQSTYQVMGGAITPWIIISISVIILLIKIH